MKKLLKLLLVQIPIRTLCSLITICFAPIIIFVEYSLNRNNEKLENVISSYFNDCVWKVIKEGM